MRSRLWRHPGPPEAGKIKAGVQDRLLFLDSSACPGRDLGFAGMTEELVF